jgi:hypothetical protein
VERKETKVQEILKQWNHEEDFDCLHKFFLNLVDIYIFTNGFLVEEWLIVK